jgi:capsular exopolysaccharide synthesis family protein
MMNQELNLKEILKYIYKKIMIIITIIIISLIVGGLYNFSIKKPTYKVTAKVLIDKADASIEQIVSSKELSQDKVTAEFDKTSKLITITTEAFNQEEAFNITNQYIENIQTKLEEIYGIKTFKIIEEPKFPESPVNMDYTKDILIALFIGIIIDGLYVVIALGCQGLTNIFEIEEYLKIKALGIVKLDKKTKRKQNIYIAKNEKTQKQLKRIQANIMLNKDNKAPQTIVLIGTKKGSGTTYITNNLAIEFAKVYSKILIIDTDIKNKTLTNNLAKKGSEGITDIINSKNIENINNFIQKTNNQNIYILPVGRNKIGEEAFLTESMLNITEELKKEYDIILIDTTSINENILPICLTSIADATVLIAESGKVKQEDIVEAKIEIENVGGKISGIVLNKSF